MKTVGIIGHGYVGKAMERFFQKHYRIAIYDPAVPGTIKLDVNWANMALVCVPTPSQAGKCDTSIVEEVVGWCEAELIIIKSTVTPGTTDRLKEKTGKRIVFSPEYCGESSYWSPYQWDRDVVESPFFTFGGDPKDTSAAVDFYLPVAGPVKKYNQTTAKVAEMAKYMSNAFAATKITFSYEMAELCAATGVDYNAAREAWLNDPRVGPMHTAVFDANDKPFGGKCLPKDTAALIEFGTENGHDPKLLREVLASNERLEVVRHDRKRRS